MKELEKKLTIYEKYKDEAGVVLRPVDKKKLLGPAFDSVQAETMMGI
jgi:hypothetical protein